jgi:hypothetical protein
MNRASFRHPPEWAIHALIWGLLVVQDMMVMYETPTFPVPKENVLIYWLLAVGYTLMKALAFYGTVRLVARPLLVGPPAWQDYGRAGAGLLVTFAGVTAFRYGVEMGGFKPLLGFDNYHRNANLTIGWFVRNSVLFYFNYITYGLLYTFIRRHFQNERDRRETEQARTAAELAFLRSQLNPHFLFNTINDIYALVYQKSDHAPGALLKLSELLRYVLHDARQDRVLLSKELDYLQSLIELQRIGSKDTLHLDYALHGPLHGQVIAPMLLVNFVENAFKHGLLLDAQHPVRLHLSLTSATLDMDLQNCKNHQQKDHTGGIGLANVHRRLELLYPARHHLQITDQPDLFRVRLHLDL